MRRSQIVLTMLIVLALASHGVTGAQKSPSSSAKAGSTELDGLLAPVALYPDTLLAQMLLCTANPAKVKELDKWLTSNSSLKGTELQDAATADGFDPEFVAMSLFPNVVRFMAENTDWTTRVGKAFAADKTAVFASIQRLRKNAHEKGTLKDTPQQDVETKQISGGEQVIVIEPANPQVIYVPQYNPQVVYTSPPPTTIVIEDDDDDVDAAVAGLIGFTAGIAIGAAIDNNYYYGPYGWHGGAYMYNDAWDDYYDHREDAREDWIDHREDVIEERGERSENAREQRTERAEDRQGTRTEGQGQRTERQDNRQDGRTTTPTTQQRSTTSGTQQRTTSGSTQAARGYSGTQQTNRDRSGTKSDAFSGYSSGSSARASGSRGQSSRGSSRSSGGGGGGGRRR